jgi:VanZ family protein
VKLTENLLEHKRTIQALTVFFTGLVAYLCLVSSHSLPRVSVFKFDKIGHFTFHFGITVIWFLFWKTTYKNENKLAVLKAFLFSFFFGVLIEICQGLFTETRKSDIHDVFANTTGALIAVVVIYLVNKMNSKPL